jgi:hypothetical protein
MLTIVKPLMGGSVRTQRRGQNSIFLITLGDRSCPAHTACLRPHRRENIGPRWATGHISVQAVSFSWHFYPLQEPEVLTFTLDYLLGGRSRCNDV